MSPRTILIIEDDPGILNFMSAILKGEDYKIITATEGSQGMSLAATLESRFNYA